MLFANLIAGVVVRVWMARVADEYRFKNLVFQGGGVLGVAYAGAVQVLKEKGILENIENVAGTSAGGIASMVLALRYNADEVANIMESTNFKDFTQDSRPLEFHDRYGWYTTKPLQTWLRKRIVEASKNFENTKFTGDETFSDLHNLGARNIKVFATDLNRREIREFSRQQTPSVRVLDAVTASLTIPAFFQSFQFPDNNPDDHIYVDGGALLNYPIMAFDDGSANRETLGFALVQGDRLGAVSDLGFGSFRLWAESLYETIKKVQINLLNMQTVHRHRTVSIDTGTISPVDFEIDQETRQWLIDQGRRATEDFLKLYEFRESLLYKTTQAAGRLIRGFIPDFR